jgi:para-nitrobenzyl esterase
MMSSRRIFLKHTALAGAASLTTRSFGATGGSSSPVAETTSGKVRGIDLNGIKHFRGIPYGGDTSGKNRFMPPAKAAKWTGVRDGSEWGHIAPQHLVTNPGDYEKTIQWDHQRGGVGEDCLNLNIWTPAIKDGNKRTVMVSYHGGGFTTGSGNLPVYDGEPLARFGDVVVVTVNHRLGALGYTDLSQLAGSDFQYSGVVGMMDCVLSLEWIRDNIENFGGNAKNVMIFGQSGGGAKTSTLLSMPSAKGLYHRAAVQSGSTIKLAHHDAATKNANELLTKLGLDKSRLNDLQSMPFYKIIAAQGAAGPVVDGKIIPRDPFHPAAPEVSADIPMIIGTELEDAGLRMTDWDLDEPGLKKWAQETLGAKADRVLTVYRKNYPSIRAYQVKARIATDRAGRRNATTQAERKAALGHAPAYLYRWDWPSPAFGGKFGAVHGIDVSLAFHNALPPITMDTPESRVMAERLGTTWVSFARTGNPNNNKVPNWPAYNATERPTMIFDNTTRVESDPQHEIRMLWNELEA